MTKRRPASGAPFLQNNRAKAARPETNAQGSVHPSARRNLVPHGWLVSIATNTVMGVLLYLTRVSSCAEHRATRPVGIVSTANGPTAVIPNLPPTH